ncbi:MAG: phosphoglycerate dehydrogenase [Clostridia bacterium]|nr:phosphoglycerate dehydrogenase [Clostridia bacterium]
MYNLLTLNKIAACGLAGFDKDKYNITDNCDNPDCIMLRSFKMHDMELKDNLLCVARAGAGVNNIPLDKCSEKGIVVFNTPGANANAVKELVIAALLLSSRGIIQGAQWAQTLKGTEAVEKAVEKGKSAFGGTEIMGKKIAVVGLGAIGVMVANAAYALGMDVVGYDPYISVKAALNLSRHIEVVTSLKDAIKDADYITLHVPLLDSTKYMINDELLQNSVKKGAKLLNFSRGELADVAAVKKALADGVLTSYVIDFPSEDCLGVDGIIAIPHLGASTEEAEDNCAMMAAHELMDYIENGNIVNSVNFPACEVPRTTPTRVVILHKNVPNMLTRFSKVMADEAINIENMTSRSKGDYAYTIMDVASDVSTANADAIKEIDGVIKVRVIS